MSGEGVVTAEEKAAAQRRGPGARRPGGPPLGRSSVCRARSR